MMLDRGEQLEWFDSPEIILEAALSVLGAYLFHRAFVNYGPPFSRSETIP